MVFIEHSAKLIYRHNATHQNHNPVQQGMRLMPSPDCPLAVLCGSFNHCIWACYQWATHKAIHGGTTIESGLNEMVFIEQSTKHIYTDRMMLTGTLSHPQPITLYNMASDWYLHVVLIVCCQYDVDRFIVLLLQISINLWKATLKYNTCFAYRLKTGR